MVLSTQITRMVSFFQKKMWRIVAWRISEQGQVHAFEKDRERRP